MKVKWYTTCNPCKISKVFGWTFNSTNYDSEINMTDKQALVGICILAETWESGCSNKQLFLGLHGDATFAWNPSTVDSIRKSWKRVAPARCMRWGKRQPSSRELSLGHGWVPHWIFLFIQQRRGTKRYTVNHLFQCKRCPKKHVCNAFKDPTSQTIGVPNTLVFSVSNSTAYWSTRCPCIHCNIWTAFQTEMGQPPLINVTS